MEPKVRDAKGSGQETKSRTTNAGTTKTSACPRDYLIGFFLGAVLVHLPPGIFASCLSLFWKSNIKFLGTGDRRWDVANPIQEGLDVDIMFEQGPWHQGWIG